MALALTACGATMTPQSPRSHDREFRPRPNLSIRHPLLKERAVTPRAKPQKAGRGARSDAKAPELASWFSGRTGACGPLLGLYAASRDFKCGERVEVTYGSKSVVVTIADYGPQAWTNRAIDLSPAAFSQLAPLSLGVIPVSIRALS